MERRGWARPHPGAWDAIWDSMWVERSQILGPTSTTFPDTVCVGLEVELSETELEVPHGMLIIQMVA